MVSAAVRWPLSCALYWTLFCGGRRGIPRLPEGREFLDAHGYRDIVHALD